MPPQVDEPEDFEGDRAPTEAIGFEPDADRNPDANPEHADEDPSDHDQLLALRSSRRVTRRPRRRKRWPYVAVAVILSISAFTYFLGWPYFQEFMTSRAVAIATAGYPLVTVEFSDGVASIVGEVNTEADIDALVAAIAGVDAVESVVNQLTLAANTASSPLAATIAEALAEAGLLMVTPVVDGSTVTLVGNVVDPADIETASSVAVNIDGVSQVLNRVVVGSDPVAAAQEVLTTAGFPSITIAIDGDIAVLTGALPTEEEIMDAADVVLGLPYVNKIDNRISLGGLDAAVPVTTLNDEIDLGTALEAAGYGGVRVTLDAETAYLDGVVPFDVIEDGYFAFVESVGELVRETEGVSVVVNRLRLRGNEQELRTKLKALLEETPIVFLSGSSDLTVESQAALDAAAEIILSQPGLQIFIAGHTDASGSSSSNEQLARTRGAAVYGYLVEAGVPANRMAVVSYGELFPAEGSSSADSRRIEFEVGP